MMRRGFSFVELLFAIMILGIGFIMIAAIFPVAIKQTAASGEETVGSTIATGAVGVISQFASNAYMPATSFPSYAAYLANGSTSTVTTQVCSIGPQIVSDFDNTGTARQNFWNAVNGNMILPSDNRYAWVAMYMRQPNQPFAQVIVIACQVRNRTQYVESVDAPGATYLPSATTAGWPSLQPKPCYVSFTDNGGTSPDTIKFLQSGAFSVIHGPNGLAAAEGTYVIVYDDPGNTPAPTVGPANANGYIYRVGNFVSVDATNEATYQLMPGNDLQGYAAGTAGRPKSQYVGALIVGRSVHDPTQVYNATSNPFEGLAQDISVYVSFVRINK